MSQFSEKVYKIVSQIPAGKVLTYAQVAKLAGNVKAARAVGSALKNNKDSKSIPCHRVVGAGGKLTGYAFGGINKKRKLLENEGVVFKPSTDLVELKVSQLS